MEKSTDISDLKQNAAFWEGYLSLFHYKIIYFQKSRQANCPLFLNWAEMFFVSVNK